MPNLTPTHWKSYLSDIRFWIILFFIVRLYGITNPPLDPSTLWRQSDVLMIARNYYEIDNNIFYPRIDVSASKDGAITGVEFPFYNYLIYLTSLLFGYTHWYGRLINLLFASVGIFYFHRLIKSTYNKEIAFTSSLLLLASAWFAYSRTTFPDIIGASICIAALFYGFEFLRNGNRWYLIIYLLLASIGCLTKISALSIMAVMVIPIFSNKYTIRKKAIICSFSTIIIAIVSIWYFHWVPYLNTIGSSYFSMGFPLSMGIDDIVAEPLRFAKKFYDDPLKYSGTIATLLAIFYSIKNNNYKMIIPPMIVIAAYFIIILKSGKWFYINGYYFVMYVPAIALLAAIGLSYIPRKFAVGVLLIIIIENIANQAHVFKVRDPYRFYTELESTFDMIGSTKKDLILVGCDQCSATSIYMSHRKGVTLNRTSLQDTNKISQYRNQGFKYILLQKGLHGIVIELPYKKLVDKSDFSIYAL